MISYHQCKQKWDILCCNNSTTKYQIDNYLNTFDVMSFYESKISLEADMKLILIQ